MLVYRKESGKRGSFHKTACSPVLLMQFLLKFISLRTEGCARQHFDSVIMKICTKNFYGKRNSIFHKCSRMSASFCKTAHRKLFCSAKKIAYSECLQLAKSEDGNFSYTSLCLQELQADRHSVTQHAALYHHQPNRTCLLVCASVPPPDPRNTPN